MALESADALDLANRVSTPPAGTPTPLSSTLSPLPAIIIQSFDNDTAAEDAWSFNPGLPSSTSVEETSQSETSQSDASQSEDSGVSDDTSSQCLVPLPRDDDEIDPVVSSLSSMRLHSRPTTPDPSAKTPLRRTPSKIWYEFREDDEDEDEDDDNVSEPSFPQSFAKSIRAIQRTQGSLDKRTTELEKELATLRSEFASSVDASKALLMKTRESILRERRSMEKTNETAADGLLSLEQKLARAQASIATLQAQHSADKQAMELMANDIAEVLAIQEDMGCRLQRLSESHQSISDKADHTRNLLTELPHDIFNMSSHSERRLVADQHVVDAPGFTLADELAAAATPNPRLPSDSDLLTSSSESEPQNGETASQHAAELAAVGGDATFLDVDELAAVSDNASLPPFVDEFDACKSSANSVSSSSVANSSPDAASSPRVLWTHLSSIAGVVSDDDTVSTVRLCVAYVTSVVWSAGTTEWFEVVKAKAGLQKLHEKFTIYSHGASVRYRPIIILIIVTLIVVVPIILMPHPGSVDLPVPVLKPVHVSDHPIWDSL